jgi:hypothetical protein
MTRRDVLRPVLALAFLVGAALFPSTASHAGLGTVFVQDPCPTVSEVSAAYVDFPDSFVGLPKCESLCKKAHASCRKAMNAQASCEFAFAADVTAFDSAVDCDGLGGADKKDCLAGWKSDLKRWRNQIKQIRDNAGLSTCDDFLVNGQNGCLRRCSGV